MPKTIAKPIKIESWQDCIRDGERQIKEAQARIAELRSAIKGIRKFQKQGPSLQKLLAEARRHLASRGEK